MDTARDTSADPLLEPAADRAFTPTRPLERSEITAIRVAVESAFIRLQNLYEQITPIFQHFGFRPPSAGVIARDLSEQIEHSIVQHSTTFFIGEGSHDLSRFGESWEVKICKGSGLTINQSYQVDGENYIVVNYDATTVKRIWVLWEARDEFFSPRKGNTNARSLTRKRCESHVQVIYPPSS